MEENKQVVAEWKALNQPRLQEIKKANPDLYSAVNLALQYLNQKLGGEELPAEIEEVEEAVKTPIQELSVVYAAKKHKLSDFFESKIKVRNEEEAKKFQELIFYLDGGWESSGKFLDALNEKYFYVDKYGLITFGTTEEYFNDEKSKEIFYDDIFLSQTESKQWKLDDFKNKKIIVDTPEKSKKFQELFISLGGEWSRLDNPNPTNPDNFDKPYLVINANRLLFYSNLKSFEEQNFKQIFYDDIFEAESKTITPEPSTTTQQNRYTLPIETYPAKLKFTIPNFKANIGDRNSPTQSAGELRKWFNDLGNISQLDYGQQLDKTRFKGNDGNWYRINIAKGGIWTWKEATPPPIQSTSSAEQVSTPVANYKPSDLIGREIFSKGNYKILGIIKVNPKTIVYRTIKNLQEVELVIPKTAIGDLLEGKIVGKAFLKDLKPEAPAQPDSNNDLLKMTDAELLKLYDEIEEAKNELDASDPEYTELRLKQIEVSDELSKRN